MARTSRLLGLFAASLLLLSGAEAAEAAERAPHTAQIASDWQLGLAHLKAGKVPVAVAHLERVVTANPANARARIALGSAYLLARDDDKARYHLNLAVTGDLSESLRQEALRHLATLSAPKVWSTRLSFAIVPQTNAVRRTSNKTVEIGGVPWKLNEDARRAAGTGVQLGAGLIAAPRLGRNLRGEASLAGRGIFFKDHEQNDISLALRLGLIRDLGRFTLSGGARGESRWLGGFTYSREAGPWFSIERQVSPKLRWGVRAEWMERRHERHTQLDGSELFVAAEVHRALTPALLVHGEVSFGHRTAELGTEIARIFGASVGGTYTFKGGLMLGLDLHAKRDLRDDPSALFGITRRDWTAMVTSRIMHRSVQWKGYAPFLEFGVEKRWSSISLNEYDNIRAAIGVTRHF